MLIVLFFMAFVVVPALFFLMEKHDGPTWPLVLGAVATVVASFALSTETALPFGSDLARTDGNIFLLWLVWALVMVLAVRAVPTQVVRKWSRALCALGTTLPWLGFADAQKMAD